MYFPFYVIHTSVFGFPKGSKYLKFTIEALFLSYEKDPR